VGLVVGAGVAGRGAVAGVDTLGAADDPDEEEELLELPELDEAEVEPAAPEPATTVCFRTTTVVGTGIVSAGAVTASSAGSTAATAGPAGFLALAADAAMPPIMSSAADALAAPTTSRLRAAGWVLPACVRAEAGGRSVIVVSGRVVMIGVGGGTDGHRRDRAVGAAVRIR